jgi:hypothetical protein
MSLWRCALILLSLLAACDDSSGGNEADGGSACGSLDAGGYPVCDPECPETWPDACNPPPACFEALAASRCNRCNQLNGEWEQPYVESFCDSDAGI